MGIISTVVPDWSWGPGSSPTTGAVITAAGAASGAMASACVGAPWYVPAIGGALVATVAATKAAYGEQPARVIGYRAASWLGGTAWATTSVALTNADRLWGTGPWSGGSIGVLVAGVLAFASFGLWLARKQNAEDAAALPAVTSVNLKLDDEDRIAAEWEPIIRKISNCAGLKVVQVDRWDTGKGFTLDCDLPATGVTALDIQRFETEIATAANLPIGCNVEVQSHTVGRRACLIRIATSSALHEDLIPDGDISPTRIADPISQGKQSDGTEQNVILDYKTTVLIGQKDSGKSTQLNTLCKGIMRTTDALIIGIDTTGAGKAFRWAVRAYKEGRAPRPAIDFVAANEEMALAVCRGVRNVIAGRTAVYAERMFAENTDKILSAPDLPKIVIVVDEFKTLPMAVKDALTDLSDTGRGSGVDLVLCGLSATSDSIPSAIIKQAYNRIGMRVSDERELQYLLDSSRWNRGKFDPASMPYPGVGVAASGANPATQFKGWKDDPNSLDAFSIAIASRRPPLDEPSQLLMDAPEAMNGLYARRWEITLPLMFPAGSTPQAPRNSRPANVGGLALAEREAPVSMDESAAEMKRALDAARAAADAADAEWAAELANTSPADASARAAEIARLNALYAASPDTDPHALPAGTTAGVAARDRMMQLLIAAGPAGAGASRLEALLRAEGYPTQRQTIAGWLRQDLAAGRVTQPGGDKTPYVAKEHS